jgi:hypothetical protein
MPLAIRNFGHFWNRNPVNWGNPGRNRGGDLRGYRIVNRRPRVTDFREQIGLYVLYGENREVLYIGQTGSGDRRLFLRLRDHTKDHLRDRWGNFSWFGFRKVNADGNLSDAQRPDSSVQAQSSAALDETESVLLQLFEPRLNKQGAKWTTTEEFLQYVPLEHENEQLSVTEKLDELSQQIDSLRLAIEAGNDE